MAITYTLRFTPDISATELQRVTRRLGEWMARQSDTGSKYPGADDHEIHDPSGGLASDDEMKSISGESISIGPGLLGPERSLEIVLHPGLFFNVEKLNWASLNSSGSFRWFRAHDPTMGLMATHCLRDA